MFKGLTVIGIVGRDEKVNWCKNELHFDHVINYKKTDFNKALSELAPNGVDIYYDNVCFLKYTEKSNLLINRQM